MCLMLMEWDTGVTRLVLDSNARDSRVCILCQVIVQNSNFTSLVADRSTRNSCAFNKMLTNGLRPEICKFSPQLEHFEYVAFVFDVDKKCRTLDFRV